MIVKCAPASGASAKGYSFFLPSVKDKINYTQAAITHLELESLQQTVDETVSTVYDIFGDVCKLLWK